MKNIVTIIAVVVTMGLVSSCSSTEKCWAYKDIKKVKQKHYRGSASATHKPSRNRVAKSMSCYSFN